MHAERQEHIQEGHYGYDKLNPHRHRQSLQKTATSASVPHATRTRVLAEPSADVDDVSAQ